MKEEGKEKKRKGERTKVKEYRGEKKRKGRGEKRERDERKGLTG